MGMIALAAGIAAGAAIISVARLVATYRALPRTPVTPRLEKLLTADRKPENS